MKFSYCICSALIAINLLASDTVYSFPVKSESESQSKPNFIIILTDDQGYNDLGCYGSENIRTPRIDQMAEEGTRFTSFYAQPVCGPSRGALMTGRYPVRIGGGWMVNPDEIMLPEILKSRGYNTACIGKWDMSGRKYIKGLIPNDKGFDYFFGTLGANDRGFVHLLRNRDTLYRTDDMSALTKQYTDESLEFIKKQKDAPFLLYLAHTMPHVQIDASSGFKGKSSAELYGDVIEEIDWNVGRILDLLYRLELDKHTYIIYLSDNGPWAGKEDFYREKHEGQLATGSAFPLRGSKGSAYEGGFRVPCIIRAPGRVPAGRVSDEIVSTLDILPTCAILSGAKIPSDRILDGFDQGSLIAGKTNKSAREVFYYHQRDKIRAVRQGKWKLMLPNGRIIKEPELYELDTDISESRNLASKHPEIVDILSGLAEIAPGSSAIPKP
jgi:arylsulfatase A-like enzyme